MLVYFLVLPFVIYVLGGWKRLAEHKGDIGCKLCHINRVIQPLIIDLELVETQSGCVAYKGLPRNMSVPYPRLR